MQDDRFEKWLREQARSYHEPPELGTSHLDRMWAEVERAHFEPGALRRPWWARPWVGIAAALVVGVGLGRLPVLNRAAPPVDQPLAVAKVPLNPVPAVYEVTTSRYFGQAAALLVSLPTEVRAGRADEQFIGRANDLLLTTRVLLDSPVADDPKVRGLLEDLELVLAQVVHMRAPQGMKDLDLINQAMEQRDVLPRLRTAVADLSAE